MDLRIDPASGVADLNLGREMNIFHVEQMRETFLETVDNCRSVRLDPAAVEEADLAGLQLLLSFQRTLQRENKQLVLVHPPSSAFRRAVRELGFAHAGGDEDTSGLWVE